MPAVSTRYFGIKPAIGLPCTRALVVATTGDISPNEDKRGEGIPVDQGDNGGFYEMFVGNSREGIGIGLT